MYKVLDDDSWFAHEERHKVNIKGIVKKRRSTNFVFICPKIKFAGVEKIMTTHF
jgi:hypothetical protein